MISVVVQQYDQIADEYYDSDLHPTCANFREASNLLLRAFFQEWMHKDDIVVEVGAGKSLLAEFYTKMDWPIENLTLLDSSSAMLRHSRSFSDSGVRFQISDVREMAIPNDSLDAVFGSLCDPYNEESFWKELRRTLRPGGVGLCTLPSFDWALAYRGSGSPEAFEVAEFSTRAGFVILLRSVILDVPAQVEMIKKAGLEILEVQHTTIANLKPDRLSSKLMLSRGESGELVTGIVFQRR